MSHVLVTLLLGRAVLRPARVVDNSHRLPPGAKVERVLGKGWRQPPVQGVVVSAFTRAEGVVYQVLTTSEGLLTTDLEGWIILPEGATFSVPEDEGGGTETAGGQS